MTPTQTLDCATISMHVAAGEVSRAAKQVLSVTACQRMWWHSSLPLRFGQQGAHQLVPLGPLVLRGRRANVGCAMQRYRSGAWPGQPPPLRDMGARPAAGRATVVILRGTLRSL